MDNRERLSLRITFFGQLLFDDLKCAANFFAQVRKFGSKQSLLGIDHNIHCNLSKSFEPNSFPQAAFHTVANNCSAEYLADRKTDAHAAILLSSQVEHRHVRAEVTAATLINLFKISVPE